ncbi:hypothetical protein E1B28_006850 [Marasmius oreades]|uniref:Uncharacterized protein n=1 Tax=Marasmius oreades TaxID=181124 RepID=A0A9P8AAV5_9AGAR|nr:uncharacterized protein E1B28_006850 [Marasmius oreades]KAG7096177.1 hypothetical protein E1B28_006850 [Marasmius oreades]
MLVVMYLPQLVFKLPYQRYTNRIIPMLMFTTIKEDQLQSSDHLVGAGAEVKIEEPFLNSILMLGQDQLHDLKPVSVGDLSNRNGPIGVRNQRALIGIQTCQLQQRKDISTCDPYLYYRKHKIWGQNAFMRWDLQEYDLLLHIDTNIVPEYLHYKVIDYAHFISVWMWRNGQWEAIGIEEEQDIFRSRYHLKINSRFEPDWVKH